MCCKNLADLDVFSKSDPLCVVSEFNKNSMKWVKLGQTEQILDDLNPIFRTRFTLNYFMEQNQRLKFELIDADGAGDYDYIGEVQTTLNAILTNPRKIWEGNLNDPDEKNLKNKKKKKALGSIIVQGEEVKESNCNARFQMRWENLNNRVPRIFDLCYHVQPVRFEILRAIPDADRPGHYYNDHWALVYVS